MGTRDGTLFPSPLVGEGAFAKAKADEGSLSAETDPSSVSLPLRVSDPPSPTRGEGRSPRSSKSQVDALAAHQRVLAIGERRHAVKEQPRRPAPDHDVTMLQTVTHRLVGPLQPAKQ